MFVSTNWNEGCSVTESVSCLREIALRHARASGSRSDHLTRLINEEKWSELVTYEFVYAADEDVGHLLNARQCVAFFQKSEWLDIGVDKEAVAYNKFVEVEALNSRTNDLFRGLSRGTVSVRPDDWQVLLSARRKIWRILGRCPEIRELHLRFGPGATTSIRKIDASPVQKMAKGFQCSADLYASGRLPEVLRELPHWSAALGTSTWSIEDGPGWYDVIETIPVDLVYGRLAFVPKSAKTHRSIVVEPTLNTMLQAGIGAVLKRRLLRAGIDITDQTRNKGLARQGSLTGELATIDLSSASDTIAKELVKFLLPPRWYNLLNAARTSCVSYKGEDFALQMFSSMGNGFTFPLETLIFWALTRSTCPGGEVSAYGDDIICPAVMAERVMDVLTFCGFAVNRSKSFWSGPFRESCGGDYYLGFDIRPYYQKHLVSGQTLFTLHNFYYRLGDTEGCDLVMSFIPPSIRLTGPDGYGDGHLLASRWPGNPKRTAKLRAKGYCGASFDTYTLEPRRFRSPYPGDWVSPLYSIYTAAPTPLGPSCSSVLDNSGLTEMSTCVDSWGRVPLWTLPGSTEYRKMSIYTLAAN